MDSCVEDKTGRKAHDFIAELEQNIASGAKTVDPLAKLLNMEMLWAGPQEAEGVMYITPEVLNPYGSVHGGCLVALADSVAGHNMIAAGKICVTLNTTVNFLSPAIGREVRCRSRIQKMGKRVSVVAVEATDEQEKLLMTAFFTFSAMKEIPPHIITAREGLGKS